MIKGQLCVMPMEGGREHASILLLQLTRHQTAVPKQCATGNQHGERCNPQKNPTTLYTRILACVYIRVYTLYTIYRIVVL